MELYKHVSNFQHRAEGISRRDEYLWVENALLKSVHINSDRERSHVQPLSKNRQLPSEFRPAFDVKCLSTRIITPRSGADNVTDKVLSVLINSNIRRGSTDKIRDHLPIIKQQINTRISTDAPIEIVLPTLPFKDQNHLTTQHTPEQIDLGEYLLFAQMRNICSSIEAIYSNGAHITLLTDGLVYADFFADGQRDQVEKYRNNCESIRDEMGLRGKVDIKDMETLVQEEPKFLETQEHIEYVLRQRELMSGEVANAIHSLEKGMLFNISVPEFSYDEYASLVGQPYDKLPQPLQKKAHETAIHYASFLLTMKKLRIVERSYPDALRATVHPKNAPQLPINLVGKNSVTFPYNGVPVVSESKLAKTNNIGRSTRIMRYYQMLENATARAVYVPLSNEPFYYMTD